MSAMVNFPVHGDAQHLLAKHGDEPADEEKGEIAVAKQSVGAVARDFGRRIHIVRRIRMVHAVIDSSFDGEDSRFQFKAFPSKL